MHDGQNSPIQIFQLAQLPGRVGKSLEVPPGYQGVVIYPDGTQKTFAPGTHRILSAFGRVRGQGAGLRIGLVLDGPARLTLSASNLLSGDRQLMDVIVLFEAQIADAGAYFAQQIRQGPDFDSTAVFLESDTIQQNLRPLIRRYAAEDLVGEALSAKLNPLIQEIVQPQLKAQGLQLRAVPWIIFSRAEDRVITAEQELALQEQLDALDLEKKMAEIETKAQMNEFINQLEDEFDHQVGFHPAAETAQVEDAEEGGADVESLLEAVRTWFKFSISKDETGRHFHLDGLFRRSGKASEEEPEQKLRRYPKYWWRGRAIWMSFVLLVALGVSRGVGQVASDARGPDRWGMILGVWTFAFIALLESVKALYQKRESFDEQFWADQNAVFIDDLVGKDRTKADALVRRQSGQDLENVYGILNDLRSRIYKQGDTEVALAIRELERKVQGYASEVKNTSFGQPPYVTDLRISKPNWLKMLDYDERLLVRSSALNEDAHQLQQLAAKDDFQAKHLQLLEGRLDAFHHRFANRSQALKASQAEQSPYRMDLKQ